MSEHYIFQQIEQIVSLMLLRCFFSWHLFKEWISYFVEFGSCCSYLPYEWCLEKKSELLY